VTPTPPTEVTPPTPTSEQPIPPPAQDTEPPAAVEEEAPAETKPPSIWDLFAFALRFDLPRCISLGDFFPFFRPKALAAGAACKRNCQATLDTFKLSSLAVYFATGPLTDTDLAMIRGDAYTGVEIDRGVTILGELTIKNVNGLANIAGLFTTTVVQAYVTFLPPTPSFTLSFGVATKLPKPFAGIVGKLVIDYKSEIDPRYAVGGSGFFISGRLRVGWFVQGELVNFQGIVSIGFTPSLFAPLMMPLRVEADLIGCINKLFGISGLAICDLGLGFGVDLVRLASAAAATAASGGLGAPALLSAFDYFRIQGGIVLGEGEHKKKFIMLIKIDLSTPINNAFIGSMVGSLCLYDLVNFPVALARKAGLKIPNIPEWFVPQVCIENPQLKVSAMSVVIAGETFEAGIAIRGNITFFGVKFGIDVSVGLIHVGIKGFADKFKFGPLELGGYGCDMIKGTKDDGLCLDIGFGLIPMDFHIKFTGAFTVFGIFGAETHATLDANGLYFRFDYKFGLFELDFEVWTNDMKEIVEQTQKPDGEYVDANGIKRYTKDLNVRMTFKQNVLDWLANTINTGVEAFKKLMDATIASSNKQISSAADKVRNSCGSGSTTTDIQLPPMTDLELAEIVDASIRRIRRRALTDAELALIDDSGPITMSGDELVSLVQRADARDAREGAPKYTLFTEAEVEQLRKNIAVEDSASELEIDLQTRAKWGFIKSKIVEPAKAAVTKAWDTVSTAVVNTYEKVKEGVKTVVAVVSDAAKTVGTAIKSAALAVGDLIVQGAKAVWEGLKEAASFVVKLVCDSVAGFLDTVVKGLVRGFLEMAKWIVYIGGKMIAKVLESAFNIRLIQYTGSLQRLVRADLGSLRVNATILGFDVNFQLDMALLGWAGIGGKRALLSHVIDEPESAAAEAQAELQTAQKTEGKDKWGFMHRHHRHHSHNPHSHHAHHAHHTHTPHTHTPVPTASPTFTPTAAPTRTPTQVPTEFPTNVRTPGPTNPPTRQPSPKPVTSQGQIGQGFESKLNEVACKALDKMGFARVCGGAAGSVIQPIDLSAEEAKMQEAFYIRTGSTVQFVTNQTTFVNTVSGGQLTSMGKDRDQAAVYEVVVIGGSTAAGGSIIAKFNGKIALKNLCNGKFVGAENGGVKADRNTDANDVVQFTIVDPFNYGSNEGIKDFSRVALKAFDGRWMGSTPAGTVDVDGSSITGEEHFSIMKVDPAALPKGKC